jgi:hypothetical protein
MFLSHEEAKREVNLAPDEEQEGWQKEKRPFIYAFTGDLNPLIQTKAEQIGFKKAFTVFRKE